jgi:hypothetical protein
MASSEVGGSILPDGPDEHADPIATMSMKVGSNKAFRLPLFMELVCPQVFLRHRRV